MRTHTTGALFKNSFGTEEMRGIVSEEAFVERFLEFEAALARAEARAGLVPEEAAAELTRKASLDHVSFERIEAHVADIGLFTVAIIEAWKEEVGDAGEYIHWGATSQDATDTAMMLTLREAYDAILRDLREIRVALADLAEEHGDTPMIGRTHYVQAVPITFGLKVATWLDEVDRHVERLEDLYDRLFVQEFFGATGTLASVRERGEEVQEYLAEELDLAVPNVAWYAARDRFAEFANALAMVAATLSKVANNVLALNRTEIREVREPIPEGEIGSSTMPHKKNPMRSETTVACARLVRALAGTMTEAMDGADERDFSTWLAEFAVLPELCLYTSRILANSREVLEGLVVDPEAMEANLGIHAGLVTSEAVMMRLGDDVGRITAHEIVYEDAMEAIEDGREFLAVLREDDRVREHLSEEELAALTDPANYTGYAEAFVERTLGAVGTDET